MKYTSARPLRCWLGRKPRVQRVSRGTAAPWLNPGAHKAVFAVGFSDEKRGLPGERWDPKGFIGERGFALYPGPPGADGKPGLRVPRAPGSAPPGPDGKWRESQGRGMLDVWTKGPGRSRVQWGFSGLNNSVDEVAGWWARRWQASPGPSRRLPWADPVGQTLRLCLLGPRAGGYARQSGCSTCGETQQLGGLRRTI